MPQDQERQKNAGFDHFSPYPQIGFLAILDRGRSHRAQWTASIDRLKVVPLTQLPVSLPFFGLFWGFFASPFDITLLQLSLYNFDFFHFLPFTSVALFYNIHSICLSALLAILFAFYPADSLSLPTFFYTTATAQVPPTVHIYTLTLRNYLIAQNSFFSPSIICPLSLTFLNPSPTPF